MQKLTRRLATLALTTLIAATPASAAKIEGQEFAEQLKASGSTALQLHGLGLLRYRYVFKAYVAGLYLAPGIAPQRALEDVPKRLEIHYFYAIRGADFGKAARTVLETNLGAEAVAALGPRLDRLSSLYKDVKPGDRYSLTYVPGLGTELALNGATRGVIPGADFAAAYFSIWLGREPIDASLKAQLLRGL